MEERYNGEKWYRENKEKALESQRKYYSKNRNWYKDFRRKIREEVINAYGGKCICCGEAHWQFLTLDHPNGGGQEDRKKCMPITGAIYGWAKKNGFPNIYRILCMNCNWVRRFNGVCPHEEERNAQGIHR